MQRLNDNEMTVVKAVYLCMIKKSIPKQLEDDLICYIYTKDARMYIYLCWLLQRWHVLFAKHDDHLPTRCKPNST